LTSASEALKKAALAIEEAKGIAKANVGGAIREVLESIFSRHRELNGVMWRQYVPYFNDGDACTFGLHGVKAQLLEGEPEELSDWLYIDYDLPEEKAALTEDLAEFESFLGECEEFLEIAFGSHAEVTISRDLKVDVEEYGDHD